MMSAEHRLTAGPTSEPSISSSARSSRESTIGATRYDTEIGRFSPPTYCHVVVPPHDPRILYTCLSPAAFSNDGALYRSSDDLAQTWRRIDHGMRADSILMAVSLHLRDPAQIYRVTRGGQVFGTEGARGSWGEQRLPSGVEEVDAVACH